MSPMDIEPSYLYNETSILGNIIFILKRGPDSHLSDVSTSKGCLNWMSAKLWFGTLRHSRHRHVVRNPIYHIQTYATVQKSDFAVYIFLTAVIAEFNRWMISTLQNGYLNVNMMSLCVSWSLPRRIFQGIRVWCYSSSKRHVHDKCFHEANFVVASGTMGCGNDNLVCHYWRQLLALWLVFCMI